MNESDTLTVYDIMWALANTHLNFSSTFILPLLQFNMSFSVKQENASNVLCVCVRACDLA